MKGKFIRTVSNSSRNRVDIHLWDIEALRAELNKAKIPASIRLDEVTMINDVTAFIKRHLSYITANNGNSVFLPYWNRLNALKSLI